MAKHVCIKKQNLNKIGYNNLREWMADKSNLYVGRYGRIFIKEDDGTTTAFPYKGSKWGNPYKVTEEIPVEQALILYEEHLQNNRLVDDLHELKNLNLGCFCDTNAPCHAKLLAKMVNRLPEKIKMNKLI